MEPDCTLLVVDDAPEMTEFVSAVLSSDQFRVVTAHSGDEALARLRAAQPDIVLLDLMMPGMAGDTLFLRLREAMPALPCVFLTGNQSVDKAVELMRSGALDYIIKPTSPALLRARLGAVRDRVLLRREVEGLRAAFEVAGEHASFVVGSDCAMLDLWRRLSLVARTDAPVLISGESGTGKEIYARALHRASKRAGGPFVAVNAGAIPLTLWESEFFGHLKGAFTDAQKSAHGLIASAEGGTLFLDEVGEIPLEAQAKLLRFLQERTYRPIGGRKELPADVRVVCASNRDLKKLVQDRAFREDLYFRINVVPARIPPLRERRADIPTLAQHFLEHYAQKFEVVVQAFTPAAMAKLTRHDWPGNVRELENVVQQVVAVSTQNVITAAELPVGSDDDSADAILPSEEREQPLMKSRRQVLDAFERAYLRRMLDLCEGNITRAAKRSGVPRNTFWRLLKKHRIDAVRDGTISKRGRPRQRQ